MSCSVLERIGLSVTSWWSGRSCGASERGGGGRGEDICPARVLSPLICPGLFIYVCVWCGGACRYGSVHSSEKKSMVEREQLFLGNCAVSGCVYGSGGGGQAGRTCSKNDF